MAIQITNNGASIKINDTTTIRNIMKNQIIEMKAMPVWMCQLIGNSLPKRSSRCLGHGVHNFFRTHDPKHVKSAKGIQRIKAGRGFLKIVSRVSSHSLIAKKDEWGY